MKTVNTEGEKSSHLLNDMRNSNEIFRKDVAQDKIKSHKKRLTTPTFLGFNKSPEVNLIWRDDELQLNLESVRSFKTHKITCCLFL